MSSGERQRLICYMALIIQNPWIFIDEIDSHLDVKNARNFYSLIQQTNKNYFIISHHKMMIREYCNQILTISNHQIKEKVVKTTNSNPSVPRNKQISLVKMVFTKSFYIFFLFLNIILMSISIMFATKTIDDINNAYYADSTNLQVEAQLYMNNRLLTANYQTLDILKTEYNDTFSKVYLDLSSFLDDNDGLYLNENLIKQSYCSDVIKENLEFDSNANKLQIYLSKKYEKKQTDSSFLIHYKEFTYENKTYVMEANIEVEIKGFLDIETECYVYQYEQLENIINSIFFVEEKGILDFTKQTPFFNLVILKNSKFIGILNRHILYKNIGKNIEKTIIHWN